MCAYISLHGSMVKTHACTMLVQRGKIRLALSWLRRWSVESLVRMFVKKCNSYVTATESPKMMYATNTEQSHWKLRESKMQLCQNKKFVCQKKGSWLNVMRVVFVSVANDQVINATIVKAMKTKSGRTTLHTERQKSVWLRWGSWKVMLHELICCFSPSVTKMFRRWR